MKKMFTTLHVLVLSAVLLAATPAHSQTKPIERGYDGDQSVKSGQRDTEDHETGLDWVGYLGLLGLVGLVGPARRQNRYDSTGRRIASVTVVLAMSALLSTGSPAVSQPAHEADQSKSITSSQQNSSGGEPSLGWIGLLGLAGLLGLRRGKRAANS
jgi:MYXO-CTERM domain-containing protein